MKTSDSTNWTERFDQTEWYWGLMDKHDRDGLAGVEMPLLKSFISDLLKEVIYGIPDDLSHLENIDGLNAGIKLKQQLRDKYGIKK